MRLISTLVSLFALAAPLVSAAVYSDFDTTGHGPTPVPLATDFVNEFLILDKFDPSLGTLTNIKLTLVGDITTTITITNANAFDVSSVGNAGIQILVTSNLNGPAQQDLVVFTANNAPAQNIPAQSSVPITPFSKNGATGNINVAYTGGPQAVFISTTPLPGVETINLALATLTTVGATGGQGISSTGSSTISLIGTIDYTYTATVTGDPQFAGFQGQQFQFHGLPDTVFNLVSSPELQMNSQFVYIASGICNYNNTACFSHAGTYLGQIGVAIGSQTFTIVSGPHSKGLRAFVQNGADRHAMIVGAKFSFTTAHGEMSISHPDNSHVEIRSPNFMFNIINSDSFFNLEASLLNTNLLQIGAKRHNVKHCKDSVATEASLMKHYPVKNYIHGLVGQTWRAVQFCDAPFQGVVGDYIASDLHSNDYRYNYFNATE